VFRKEFAAMSRDERKDVPRVMLAIILGGRTQRELEAVEAVINPAHFHLADGLLARLGYRAKLRCAFNREEGGVTLSN
jgi:hypothetical protein